MDRDSKDTTMIVGFIIQNSTNLGILEYYAFELYMTAISNRQH